MEYRPWAKAFAAGIVFGLVFFACWTVAVWL